VERVGGRDAVLLDQHVRVGGAGQRGPDLRRGDQSGGSAVSRAAAPAPCGAAIAVPWMMPYWTGSSPTALNAARMFTPGMVKVGQETPSRWRISSRTTRASAWPRVAF